MRPPSWLTSRSTRWPRSCSHPIHRPMKSHSTQPVEAVPELIAATAQALPHQADALQRSRAFAQPFIASETLDTGENTLTHADAVAAILHHLGGSQAMQAASYLVYAAPHL